MRHTRHRGRSGRDRLRARICFGCAAVPALLYLWNSFLFREPPSGEPRREGPGWRLTPARSPPISVLIPARNEELGIAACLESVLASQYVELELIVLDDHSTDRTAEIVREIAAKDSRVRIEAAPPLPEGWCGKQHACFALSKFARIPCVHIPRCRCAARTRSPRANGPLPQRIPGAIGQRFPQAGDGHVPGKAPHPAHQLALAVLATAVGDAAIPLVGIRGWLRAMVHDPPRRLRESRRPRRRESVAARWAYSAARVPPRRVHDGRVRRD